MTVRVEIFARGHGKRFESELSKIFAWEKELFAEDKNIIDAFVWENKRGLGFNIQTYRDDELVGFAHIFVRVVRRNRSMVLMGGLGGVMTAKEHQGAGIGSTTVKEAGDAIFRNFRADLGVLLCTSALVPFYEPLGWRRVQRPVMIEQPTGKTRWPHETMVLLKETDDSVPRDLDLCGLPF